MIGYLLILLSLYKKLDLTFVYKNNFNFFKIINLD